MAAGPAIGADWVAAYGQGRLAQAQREELRAQLLRDIEARGGERAAAQAQNEVDLFLRNGRVSDSNLKRLERRVFSLAGEGALSARGEGAKSLSEFSAGSSAWQDVPQSARTPSRRGNPELDALLRALAPGAAASGEAQKGGAQKLPSVPEAVAQKMGKWSEVAKYAKELEDKEKEQRKETTRSQQQQMRQDLQLQMAEKRMNKQRLKAEETELHKHQEAELLRWRHVQDEQKEEAKNKALQVNKDREVQRARTLQLREEEAARKKEEDGRLVQKAAQELDDEVKMLHDRKMQKKMQQQKMAEDMKEEGRVKEESRKVQAEKERQNVKDYHRMLEEQQARNRNNIVVRTVPELPAPPPLERGKDVYSEANVMSQLKEFNRLAEEAEYHRREKLKSERQTNQDFLFQQIAERDKMRRQVVESKGSAKKAAQDATNDYLVAERRRIEEQREKNTRYRLELEEQISAKRASQLPRQTEDQMTKAERAINRRLLREVVDLKGPPPGQEA